jgi:hypothetical protein
VDWLRANYERAAVIAAAAFLILCSIFIFLSASGFSEKFQTLQNVPPRNNKIPAGKAPEIVEATQQLQAPAQWTASGRSGLFVPEKHLSGPTGSRRLCKIHSSILLCLTNGWKSSVFRSPKPTS